MSGVLAIYRRELAGLFMGPLAWILLCIALVLNGYLYSVYVKFGTDVDAALRMVLGNSIAFWVLVILFPPLLTMRMLSEESRSGLLEFLLTAPVTDAAVVTGKFLAAVTFMALLWSSVFVYAFVTAIGGPPADWGLVVGGWLGATLCSALFCSIGLFTSSLTSVPVAAALSAVVLDIGVVALPLLAGLSDAPAVMRLVRRVHVLDHLQNSFLFGVLDTAYVAFFLAWSALFLFFTVRSVESRRWR
ncbi:MAG: ABC-2 transporter permease [Planctomycetes bacterium]|nr:ABC-2 transporter permease [Planctomycetota bacterium]